MNYDVPLPPQGVRVYEVDVKLVIELDDEDWTAIENDELRRRLAQEFVNVLDQIGLNESHYHLIEVRDYA